MFRRAEFFNTDFPLKIEEIEHRFRGIKNKPRKIRDKNYITKHITLECSFDNKKEKDGNYLLGIDIEYQISAKKGIPYQKTRDFYTFMFFPKNNLLVVVGRDTAICDAINEVSKILYPNVDNMKVFSSVMFGVKSMVTAIKNMRDDDPNSWCDEYGARHDALKYQGKKTKSNFSLGEGYCVLDDSEAKEAIAASTSISPKYKFVRCPKLNQVTYDAPKTMSFNGREGVISISVNQSFDHWYKFISDFLLKTLEFNS